MRTKTFAFHLVLIALLLAALTYNKDNRTATVSILTDVSTGKTLVAVNILTN